MVLYNILRLYDYGTLVFTYVVPLWHFNIYLSGIQWYSSINVRGTSMVLYYLRTWCHYDVLVFTYMVPQWYLVIYQRGATIVLY